MKDTQIGKKVKGSLFAEGIILYTENINLQRSNTFIL